MKQKNPEYESNKIQYEALYSTYEKYLKEYGGSDVRTARALNEQATAYWKWKSTPEFLKEGSQ